MTAYQNPTNGRAVVLQIPGMHEVDVVRDLVYSAPEGDELLLDLYRPQGSSEPTPLVLIGGPPAYQAGKSSGQKVGWGQLVAASGMSAAVFDIRSDNFVQTPQDPSTDVAAAIAYVRANAETLQIDPDRLCTLGFSIGTAPWHLWAAMREPQPHLRCNVVYYGAMDLGGLGFDVQPQAVEEYSALTYLRRDGAAIAPMLIAKAGRETFAGINVSIDRFVGEARTLGAPVTLIEHANGVHGFDAETNDERTLEIMTATLDFFRRSLSAN
jgi:acetyl esterase/lipase